MRVLVTGSRDWDDMGAVMKALDEVADTVFIGEGATDLVVVHGSARGADSMASLWARWVAGWWQERGLAISEEPHPADWKTHGKKAGFLRNAEMVELGADICLAFIKNKSRGASMTAALAEEAGIPVRRFEA